MAYAKQTVRLDDQGVVRIEGRNLDDLSATSNMVGKSTILEAIVWVLFKKTIRGLRDDAVISSSVGKNCKVVLDFSVSNSRFRAIRYRNHFRFSNRLRLLHRDRELSYRHESETQAKLEEILCTNYSTFVNSTIFGGTKPFASLSDAEQKKLLESFLHFERVDSALEKTKQRLNLVSTNLLDLDLKIERQRGEIRELKAKIESAEGFAAKIEEERKQINTELASLGRIKSWKKKIKKAEQATERSQARYFSAKEKSNRLEKKLSRIKELLKSKKKLIGKNCPLCGQICDLKNISVYLKHLKLEKKGLLEELDQLKARRIQLIGGKVALVSSRNFKKFSKRRWYSLKSGKTYYATRTNKKGRTVLMHREIFNGTCDHKNRNGLDNRDFNLRSATKYQQAWNRGRNKTNISGYKGVYKARKFWRAKIVVKEKRIRLGLFKSRVEAARAYDRAAKKYYGEYAVLNFPIKKKKFMTLEERQRRYNRNRKVLEGLKRKEEIEKGKTARRKMLKERLDNLLGLTGFSFNDYKYSQSISQLLILLGQKAKLEQVKKDLEFWVIGFGNKGIKALIVRKALPSLNQKLAEYAEKIFDGPVDLKFAPAKELKSGDEKELFHVHYGKNTGYLGESSGGRKRIDIAILLVFQWLNRTSNILLVDELLDSLDSAGRETVLELLGTLRGTVFVISHRRDVNAQIGRIWTVVKRNGVARLEAA